MKYVEPFYHVMGQRIQRLRTKQGMTQERLGGLLDPSVTRASIANIESGKQRVMAHTLVQLAEALQTDVIDLIPALEKREQIPSHKVEVELAQKLPLSNKDLKKLTAQIMSSRRRKQA
jgi:transcriptional regulator with XRE-family HTH domain